MRIISAVLKRAEKETDMSEKNVKTAGAVGGSLRVENCGLKRFREEFAAYCSESADAENFTGSVDVSGNLYLTGGDGKGREEKNGGRYSAHLVGTAREDDGGITVTYSGVRSLLLTACVWGSGILVLIFVAVAVLIYATKGATLGLLPAAVFVTAFAVFLILTLTGAGLKKLERALTDIAVRCASAKK